MHRSAGRRAGREHEDLKPLTKVLVYVLTILFALSQCQDRAGRFTRHMLGC